MGQITYRVRQFRNGLVARLSEEDHRRIAQQLSPPEQLIFWSMSGYGRRHALDVYGRLVERGCQDQEVLTAALLHDAGKGRISLAHRVMIVLLGRFWPGMLRWLAKSPTGWRRGFYLDAHHAEIGAEMARQAGSNDGVIDLIRRHGQKDGDDWRLVMLRAADDDS